MMRNDASTRERGHAAETLAKCYLEAQGMTFLERNVELCGAEVDLIMEDKDAWVFVEVRARENCRDIHPLETITRDKQLKVIRVATIYLCNAGCYQTREVRFDAVAVSLADNSIEWIKAAFTP
ncbi:MAG: YraN family protein [Gammaproteobacteria bacterium]